MTAEQKLDMKAEQVFALRAAIKNFLWAVDHGYYGDSLRCGPEHDGAESAFVSSLREVITQTDPTITTGVK